MFWETGVTRPRLDEADLNGRKGSYESLASAGDSAHTTLSNAVTQIAATNAGDAADAFDGKARSLADHLDLLSSAAGRTAGAYGEAATKGSSAQTAMVALASDRSREFYRHVLLGEGDEARIVLDNTRRDLQRLETQGGNDIDAAFSHLDLPAALNRDPDRGKVDSQIDEDWRRAPDDHGMTDQQKKDLLQKMADKYAADHDFPPIKIDWSKPDDDALGVYIHRPPFSTLKVDPAHLDDPGIIVTVIHEMQHRRQYTGYNAIRMPGVDYRNGMSREDAERWNRLNADHVRNKGDDPTTEDNEGYWERPVEVDAREESREYLDNLSYDEYMKMKDSNYTAPTAGGTVTTKFQPTFWKQEGEKVDAAAQSLYRGAEGVITMKGLPERSNSPIDVAAARGDALCLVPWHRIVAGAKEHMTSLGSKMVATGSDYAATEEANTAAADRFWR